MLQTHTKLYLKENERKLMRRAGQFNAMLMDHVRQFVKPGVTTGRSTKSFTTSRFHISIGLPPWDTKVTRKVAALVSMT